MSIRPKPIADLEWIQKDSCESFRWLTHDFPCAISRWNYHPEHEIHLIRESHGRTFVGDYIGEFGPGYLTIVGPNIPHNWVPTLRPGQVYRDRDVVLQFNQETLRGAARFFPELAQLEPFLEATRRGIEFYGETAFRGAVHMEEIGKTRGYKRLLIFLDLLELLAGSTEARPLTSVDYAPHVDQENAHIVHVVLDYILSNLGQARMSEAAKLTHMSSSTFSRFFLKNTGQNFVSFVHKVRISQACQLLANSTDSITDICFACGYSNISNFNRHFLREKHMIPSVYRRMSDGKFVDELSHNQDKMGQIRPDRERYRATP